MIRDYTDMVIGSGKPDIQAIMRLRMVFSNHFYAHMAAEGEALRGLRSSGPSREVDRLLDQYDSEMRGFFLRHSKMIQQWPPKRITQEWEGYREAICVQQQGFFAFLDWEEAVIHPLLVNVGGMRRAG